MQVFSRSTGYLSGTWDNRNFQPVSDFSPAHIPYLFLFESLSMPRWANFINNILASLRSYQQGRTVFLRKSIYIPHKNTNVLVILTSSQGWNLSISMLICWFSFRCLQCQILPVIQLQSSPMILWTLTQFIQNQSNVLLPFIM
jgi:hypothetical protein